MCIFILNKSNQNQIKWKIKNGLNLNLISPANLFRSYDYPYPRYPCPHIYIYKNKNKNKNIYWQLTDTVSSICIIYPYMHMHYVSSKNVGNSMQCEENMKWDLLLATPGNVFQKMSEVTPPLYCFEIDCGSVAVLVVAVLDCGRFDLLPSKQRNCGDD